MGRNMGNSHSDKIKIEPAEIENQEEVLTKALEWRKTPHEYEIAKPFKDVHGQFLKNLFCGKCGLSEHNSIHI